MTAKTDLELETLLDETGEDREELDYFYDDENNYWRLREERDDVPNIKHNDLVDYLKQVLLWLYRFEKYQVNREVNFYETANPNEKPLYPDIFVLKSSEGFPAERGYRLGVDGPPPEVIIEIASQKTIRVDLKEKPARYQAWGVAEYFVYDPRERKRKLKKPRLVGWRMVGGKYQELEPEANGWLWSEQLDSWLAPDEAYLRLYDADKNLRLTGIEAVSRREEFERAEKEKERREREALQQEMQRLKERLRQLEENQNN